MKNFHRLYRPRPNPSFPSLPPLPPPLWIPGGRERGGCLLVFSRRVMNGMIFSPSPRGCRVDAVWRLDSWILGGGGGGNDVTLWVVLDRAVMSSGKISLLGLITD